MMIELTYLIAALAAGKLGGLDGHALQLAGCTGHGRLFTAVYLLFSSAHLHSPRACTLYHQIRLSARRPRGEGAADEVELLQGDGQRGLQLISLCDLADMMAEQAPGRESGIRLAFRS